jgi:hypothetical protein
MGCLIHDPQMIMESRTHLSGPHQCCGRSPISVAGGLSGPIGTHVLTFIRYEAEQQLVHTSQLVPRSGWLDQARTNADEVGKQGSGVHRRRIVKNSGPDALQRLKPPCINPLLDGTHFGVCECPGAHRHLQLGPVDALCAGNGSREAGERCPWAVGCCAVDGMIERLYNESLVRGKNGLLEVR